MTIEAAGPIGACHNPAPELLRLVTDQKDPSPEIAL